MARIIFVNRFFYPDQSATSQILTDLAFALAADGHDVHVVAGRKLYAASGPPLDAFEVVRGVKAHRIGAVAAGSRGIAGRLRDYISFYRAAGFKLRSLATPDSIVVAKTDPPLLSVLAALALLGKRARLVNWLQDIYPEVAGRLGIRVLNGPAGRALAWLRDKTLRSAFANVVLGSRMAEFVAERGAPANTIRTIPNWVDDVAIQPVAPEDNIFRREWGLGDKFVVGYSGNLGRAHEYATLLGAAEVFKGRSDIVFLFIGGGFQYSSLPEEIRKRGVEDLVLFKPWQDQSKLAHSLGVPDIHWLSLLPEMEGLIVPSKFYGIVAAGRPTIAITERDGEIARIVTRHDCGAVVEPGDSAGLARILEDLMNNPEKRARWGSNARAMLDEEFSRRHALRHWRDLVGAPDRPSPD